MPVKISSKPPGTGSDMRVITANEFSVGRVNFNEHYATAISHLPEPQPRHELGNQENKVWWHEFAHTVIEYMNTYPDVAEADIAMRFVHCYEPENNKLYQRMQLCKMGPIVHEEGQEVRYLDSTKELWYEIKDDTVQPTGDTQLHDDLYLDFVGYRHAPAATEEERLIEQPGKFVHNITYPWLSEIHQMYVDNHCPLNAKINIAAFTRISDEPIASNVEFPHGLVLYLSVGTNVYINNEHYITPFNHKGADMGTLCPPMCGIYVVPQSAPSGHPKLS